MLIGGLFGLLLQLSAEIEPVNEESLSHYEATTAESFSRHWQSDDGIVPRSWRLDESEYDHLVTMSCLVPDWVMRPFIDNPCAEQRHRNPKVVVWSVIHSADRSQYFNYRGKVPSSSFYGTGCSEDFQPASGTTG